MTSLAIDSSSEKSLVTFQFHPASSVSSLFVNMYSISSRVIFRQHRQMSSESSDSKRLVDADKSQTKGLTNLTKPNDNWRCSNRQRHPLDLERFS